MTLHNCIPDLSEVSLDLPVMSGIVGLKTMANFLKYGQLGICLFMMPFGKLSYKGSHKTAGKTNYASFSLFFTILKYVL